MRVRKVRPTRKLAPPQRHQSRHKQPYREGVRYSSRFKLEFLLELLTYRTTTLPFLMEAVSRTLNPVVSGRNLAHIAAPVERQEQSFLVRFGYAAAAVDYAADKGLR